MKWSQLSNVQLAYLACGAAFTKDTVKHGKVISGKAQGAHHKRFAIEEKANAKALIVQGLRDQQRDADRARDALNKALMLAALDGSNVRVKRLPAGTARGAGFLHRKTAGALPMGQSVVGSVHRVGK